MPRPPRSTNARRLAASDPRCGSRVCSGAAGDRLTVAGRELGARPDPSAPPRPRPHERSTRALRAATSTARAAPTCSPAATRRCRAQRRTAPAKPQGCEEIRLPDAGERPRAATPHARSAAARRRSTSLGRYATRSRTRQRDPHVGSSPRTRRGPARPRGPDAGACSRPSVSRRQLRGDRRHDRGRPVDHRRRLDDVLVHARAPSARARARGRRAAGGAAPACPRSRPTTFSAPAAAAGRG